MRTNNKKGISLLVLVITILVMVILAGAIILQIRNSKITEKAEKAKVSSDNANLKEYIELVKADWEMMTKKEQKATGCKTRAAYINKMLEQEGYTNIIVKSDGTIYDKNISQDAIEEEPQIGDRVNYIVTSKTETSLSADTGSKYSEQTISNYTNFVWRYIGMNENEELLIAPDMNENNLPAVYLQGTTGWLKRVR